ncbi:MULTISPECIES: hypothetical protein [Acetobacter]|uniref:Uncharacterized protein n=1 Tax=Acetobacter thailandicus TaxID=1502842 RepID=A0ABT3QDY0_9PROT|nr:MULTISPECIES: hypothetical protein [Acetobacter]MBS0961057.1 hypothetical protein [Acetobacter thailandicus]MBS0981129.1 hypothetical protein [Acetobacter thailandicus]MBS0986416.1 hypothetical protein [Acetobacter thailandicus]MBS1004572.1 hypothetical protein [Acetobacter thailandicus]MCX2563497.1 hypothetical protein [Acetobacter thailandicus]
MPSVISITAQRSVMRVSALLGAVLCLSGCKLIDQKTFNPQAGKPPVPYIPPQPPGPPPVPPLLQVVAGTPSEEWRVPVETMVKKALQSKANILFTVKCLVPSSGLPDHDRSALTDLVKTDGQAMVEALTEAGAPPGQVEITAMPDSSVTKPVVRVYVR